MRTQFRLPLPHLTGGVGQPGYSATARYRGPTAHPDFEALSRRTGAEPIGEVCGGVSCGLAGVVVQRSKGEVPAPHDCAPSVFKSRRPSYCERHIDFAGVARYMCTAFAKLSRTAATDGTRRPGVHALGLQRLLPQ